MKFLNSLFLASMVFLLVPSAAKADLFIEPYLGYEVGRVNMTTTTDVGWSGNTSGVAIGARLGYSIPLLFAALDYAYASDSTSSMSGSGAPADGSATRSSLGLVAGVKIPMLRAYAGYGFSDKFTLKPSSGDLTLTGTSIKLGASFTGLPLINLNLEYVMATYTSFDPNSLKAGTNNTLLASVSLPWEF